MAIRKTCATLLTLECRWTQVQHLLTTCVFARHFWFSVLQSLNLSHLVPGYTSSSFADWWKKSWKKLQKQLRKGLDLLVNCNPWCLDPLEAQEYLSSMEQHQICRELFRPLRIIFIYGKSLAPKGLLP
jgi:hypothetical protein